MECPHPGDDISSSFRKELRGVYLATPGAPFYPRGSDIVNTIKNTTVRGLLTAMAASAVLAVSVPAFAAPSPSSATYLSSQSTPVQLAQYRRFDRGGASREFSGTIGRVDYGQHVFRLFADNGRSYHVDAQSAALILGDHPVRFHDIPGSGPITVVGYFDGHDSIRATEVRFHRHDGGFRGSYRR
jgi:hypothetical protein